MGQLLKHIIITIGLIALSLSAASALQDTKIPDEMLGLAFEECRQQCLQQADAKSCEFLCRCSTVEELPKRMTFDQYLAFRQGLVAGDVDPLLQTVLDDIGKFCFARFEASGMQIGPPDAQSGVRTLPKPQ